MDAKAEDLRNMPLESHDYGAGRKGYTMQDWFQCPECGKGGISLISDNFSQKEDEAVYVGKCPHCGWKGEIWFDVIYSEHITDPNGFASQC